MAIRDTVIAFGTVSGAATHARGGETAPPPDTRRIRLEEKLVLDPEATFYLQVEGDPAVDIGGARGGDWLVVDRSVAPRDGALVIASLDGDLVLRRIEKDKTGAFLLRDVRKTGPRSRTVAEEASVWGVVSWVIRRP